MISGLGNIFATLFIEIANKRLADAQPQTDNDNNVNPCVIFSHELSPAECNYDVGNWELLAVKLALED